MDIYDATMIEEIKNLAFEVEETLKEKQIYIGYFSPARIYVPDNQEEGEKRGAELSRQFVWCNTNPDEFKAQYEVYKKAIYARMQEPEAKVDEMGLGELLYRKFCILREDLKQSRRKDPAVKEFGRFQHNNLTVHFYIADTKESYLYELREWLRGKV